MLRHLASLCARTGVAEVTAGVAAWVSAEAAVAQPAEGLLGHHKEAVVSGEDSEETRPAESSLTYRHTG